jgi:hypothetical protein
MKKITFLIAFMLAAVSSGYAQFVSDYTFSQSTGNAYTPITGGTALVTCDGCGTSYDGQSYLVTLPTPFTFNGAAVSTVTMRVDGSLALGTATAPTNSTTPISATTTAPGIISALGMDLRNTTITGQPYELRWEDTGTEYVFQWKNASRWSQNTAERFNFQVRINKATGVINIAYGDMITIASSTTYQPEVGLRGATNADYNNRVLTTTVPDAAPSWDDTARGTSNSDKVRFTTGSPAATPISGLIYTYTPPAACSGMPVAGTVTTTTTRTICSGAAPGAITVSGVTSALPGITYTWEQSTDNGANWGAAVGGTATVAPGATVSATYTPPAYAGAAIQYRLKITCTNTNETAYSGITTINPAQAPTTQVTALAAFNSYSAINVSWTNGNGSRRIVVVSESPIVDPVDATGVPAITAAAAWANAGQQIVYDGTGSSVTVTGLACATTYYIKVYEYFRCGSGPYDMYYNTSTGTNVATVTMLAATKPIPETATLTGYTGSNLHAVQSGWFEAAIPTTAGTTPAMANPLGITSNWTSATALGITTARINLFTNTVNAWIVSPKMELTNDSRLVFKAAITDYSSSAAGTSSADPGRMQGTDDKVNILISTDDCGDAWEILHTFDASNTTALTNALQNFVFDLSDYTGQTVQIAFQGTDGPLDDTPDYEFHIGGIVIEETPQCDDPALLPAGTVTKNSAVISWNVPTAGTPTGYEYVVSTTNTAPATAGTAVTGTSATVSSLLPSTTYYVFVRTVCGSTFSEWSPSTSFTTLCEYPEITGTTPAAICGQGSATISAAVSAGGLLTWYDAATGGNIVGTGTSFTTPVLSATTNYYVEANTQPLNQVGATYTGTSTNGTSTGSHGIMITTTVADVTIKSAKIPFTGTGTFTVVLRNAANTTTIASFTTPTVTGAGTTAVTVPLDIKVPAAGNYLLIVNAVTGTIGGLGYSNGTFPYTAADNSLSVTNGYWFGSSASNMYLFNLSVTTGCISPRQQVAVTVSTAPAITASATDTTTCAGDSTDLTATSANANYTYVWMPGNLTGATVTVNPTATTVYTVTATDANTGCVTTGTVTINVDPVPTATGLPDSVTTCSNTPVQLAVTGATSLVTIFTENFNAATNNWTTVNNSTGTNSTLAAWTLIADNATVAGDGPFRSNDQSQFYQSNIDLASSGSVVNTALQSPAFSTVGYASASVKFFHHFYEPTTNSSTGKVEASIDGTNWTTLQTYNSTTGGYTSFASADVALTAAFLNQPTVYIRFKFDGGWRYYWSIDNVSVSGQKTAAVTWAPQTGLYTDAAATVAYTGGAAAVVYAKPAANTTYTVTATTGTGCFITDTVEVISNDCSIGWGNLQHPASITMNTCDSETVYAKVWKDNVTNVDGPSADMKAWIGISATNDDPSTWTEANWHLATYNVQSGNDDEYQYEIAGLPAGTYYYASRFQYQTGPYLYGGYVGGPWNGTSNVNGVLTVNTVATPAAAATQNFCESGTVANLATTSGTNIKWYADADGGTALDGTTALVNGETYFATQTVDGCESARTQVTVTITTLTVADPADVVECNSYTLPVLNTGNYFTAPNGGGTQLNAGDVITTNQTIYVYAQSGTTPNCTAEQSFTVTLTIVAAPTGAAQQTISAATAEEATIEDIVTNETGVIWFASEADAIAGTPALAAGTQVFANTSYWGILTNGTCNSAPFEVLITEVLGSKGFDMAAFSYYPNPVKDVLNMAYSSDITSVSVYNMIGQQVMVKEINATEATIDMSPLADGTYIVNVTAGDSVKTLKVVKKQ